MTPEKINSFAAWLEETLDQIDIPQKEVALATGIPETHLSQMKHGKRRVTPEYDLRLTRYYGISEGYCLRLQMASDLYNVRLARGAAIEHEVKPLKIA
jgi:addiction module HigA family antidote